MLGQIWQNIGNKLFRKLLRWFRCWFGSGFGSGGKAPKLQAAPIAVYKKVELLKPLEDADYEFLFMQLLEGVAHGWQQKRVLHFLASLRNRTTETEWLGWLRRFGKRLLATPTPNYPFAREMILLGEIGCGKLGEVAREIGNQLLAREQNQQVLRFANEDIYIVKEDRGAIEAQTIESIPINESLVKLSQDPSLAKQLAKLLQIEPADTQAIFETAIDRSGAIELTTKEAEKWLNLANQQYSDRDILGAIISYDKAISIYPNYHDAWFNRGVALKDLGRYEEAILSYDRALDIQPNSDETWMNRGAALRSLGCLEDAIVSYEQALQLNPDKYQAWYNRGIALLNLGRIEEAIFSYDRALEIKPYFHQAWNNRGNALLNLERFEEALFSYDKALEIKPDKAESWNNRGTALFNLGRLDEAIFSYEKSLEIQPNFQEARQNINDTRKKYG
ncbi:tetratricopeptide repeat protein [Aerosakkonema funiforme]|uniref:Tetratricopeptide repeat protein n=1 Tax=Aerosakkonema funiforme FACHB-1375 TaxID=2949571 RepID=A0A926ZHZ0_9CYAN|nr:tetratricopeptide repeat protein [Aerosakkonema funiforme]MBD2183144.1 tetratricopeptide repeat protein [Aerosakkonema funiforme FACHB-1375]